MSIQQMLLGASGASGYNIDRSVRLRASASAYLNRTPASASNRRTWTWSGWVKRGALSFQGIFTGKLVKDDTTSFYYASDKLWLLDRPSNVTNISLSTDAVYRDPSAWYHVVLAVDTTNATSTDRIKIYVNNTRQTLSGTYPSLNYEIAYINNTQVQALGVFQDSSGFYFDGYLADVNFIDGQALTPASFGETNAITGVWQPAPYTGTYGTNGFILDFEDTSSVAALGTDSSGNGNTWTVNNVSLTAGVTYDSMTDVPTLTSATAANYAVLNPLVGNYSGAPSNANLRFFVGVAAWGTRVSTILAPSGKYYFEVTPTADASTQGIFVGVSSFITPDPAYIGQSGNSYGYYSIDGRLYTNGTNSAFGATYTNNDVIGVAIDIDAGTLRFYKNNTQQGSTITGLSGSYYFGLSSYASATASINFGQQPFAYTPPTGFVALNAFNLPTATVLAGNTVMDATLYTGNGSTQTITNAAGFQPDLVWAKARSSGSWWHILVDSVRGVGRTLSTNVTNAEIGSGTDCIPALNSNGFNVNVSPNASVNENGTTYVGWQWQAGQGTTSSNTDGSITSTVSVNPTAGFSIATYTGTGANATVGHGLGVAPKMVIVKNRNSTFTWRVYHASLANTQVLYLSATDAATTETTAWNSTTPTSTVFSVGTGSGTNGSTNTYVAYCWSEIDGFSKFGSYTGNGSADGTFVYTGFRPKWVMIKWSSVAGTNWNIFDTSRDTFNVEKKPLAANTSDSEATLDVLDGLSNGFKLRTSASANNSNGGTYIYAAFAENPFKNSLAR